MRGLTTRLIGLFVMLLMILGVGVAQTEPGCGTVLTKKDIAFAKKLQETAASRIASEETREPVFIGITPHIVRRSDGSGGLSDTQLLDAIEYLNESYADLNVTFFIADGIKYISNDTYFDFDSSQEGQLTGENNVDNTINIYFFNSLSSGASALCGYAYFPTTGRDHVMMANGCTTNRGSTLPHEIGHYLNLYHTHGKTNTGTTDELVDGSNCSSAGDDICDTPADPNLSGKVDGNCQYTGSNTDANGTRFSPNPRNFMSYAPGSCRELFTNGQEERMLAAYHQFKTYLIDKYYSANFSTQERRVCEGQTIQFVNESISAASYAWEFPGGSPSSSTEAFPEVLYETAGEYDVELTITTDLGDVETKTLANYVKVTGTTASALSKSGSFEGVEITEEVYNRDLGVTFQLTDVASSDGNQSLLMPFKNYSTENEEDFLIIDRFDVSTEKQFRIEFDYAYARYDDEFFDKLAVAYKSACGDWINIWQKEGSDLATAPDHTINFIPESNEWGSVVIDYQFPTSIDVAEIAFRTTNGFGNNLYLDNYNVATTSKSFSIESVAVTNATCSSSEDGSLAVSVSAGGSYEYSINGVDFQTDNQFQNLTPGEYQITVRDNGTQDEIGYSTVVGPDPITFTVNSIRPTCSADFDGYVQIVPSGGTGTLSVNFDNGGLDQVYEFTDLEEGFYTFSIQDENGCLVNSSITISAINESPEQPVITSFAKIISTSVEQDVTSIQWYLNGEAIDGATTSILTNPGRGSYTVEVSNEFCSSLSDPFVVLSIDEIDNKLNFYPNPVEEKITFDLDSRLLSKIQKIEVRDLTGKLIGNFKVSKEINLAHLNAGLYSMTISTEEGSVVRKFVKK